MSCCANKKQPDFTILESSPVVKTTSERLNAYRPLFIMVLTVLLGSIALTLGTGLEWMTIFMGLFLLNFAMFKLFDVGGFAKSFAMYDSLAKRSKIYARIYPFIELALALGFLSHYHLETVNVLTAILMGIGLVGVIQNRLSGNQTRCACMGSLIDVPVGSITILENTGMIAMSLYMLTFHSF